MGRPIDFEETREWIEDWRDGQFDSGSRDKRGWPIEMHGVVGDVEQLLAYAESLEEFAWRYEELSK